jgi:hypothetical protein
MNFKTRSALGAAAMLLASQAMAQITFYEGEGYRGRAFSTDRRVGNFDRFGFNDRVGSIVVDRGRWEVCEQPRFEGRCVVLRRGAYDSLRPLGMGRYVASARPLDDRRRITTKSRRRRSARTTPTAGARPSASTMCR